MAPEQCALLVFCSLFEQLIAGSGKTSMKSHLRLVTPGTVNRTVTAKRRPNADLRTREHLTEAEVERLLRATMEIVGLTGMPQ
jgi:hypothetical protein